MRKYVATAAVAASAAATFVLTPFAAHAAIPTDSEIRTGCDNGVTGFVSENPALPNQYTGANLAASFALSPGTSWDISNGLGYPAATPTGSTLNGAAPNLPPGTWTISINQPDALPATGPSLDNDKGFPFGVQRVEKAVVTFDNGVTQVYYNDKSNNFTFYAPQQYYSTYTTGTGAAATTTTVQTGVPFHLFFQCGIGKA